MAEADTLTSVLRAYHRDIDYLFSLLRRTHDGRRRATVADSLVVELVRHSVMEEQTLHPTVCAALPGGTEATRESHAEHLRIEDRLRELEPLDPAGTRAVEVLTEVAATFAEHVLRQEEVLTQLEHALHRQQLATLADDCRLTAEAGVTHARPAVPGLSSDLLHPRAGMVERLRGAFWALWH